MVWPASRGGHCDDTRRTGNNLNCIKYGYFIKNQDISADRKYVGNIKSLMTNKHIIYHLYSLDLSSHLKVEEYWILDATSHNNIIIMSHVLFNVSFVSLFFIVFVEAEPRSSPLCQAWVSVIFLSTYLSTPLCSRYRRLHTYITTNDGSIVISFASQNFLGAGWAGSSVFFCSAN